MGPQDQVTLITAEGMALRTGVESFPEQGRTARGKRIMNLQARDTVVSLARLGGNAVEGEE